VNVIALVKAEVIVIFVVVFSDGGEIDGGGEDGGGGGGQELFVLVLFGEGKFLAEGFARGDAFGGSRR